LDHPLPWANLRQVYAVLGLTKKWAPERVNTASGKAANGKAFTVAFIGRMLVRLSGEDHP
jgi:hypothetical protein